MYSNMLMERTSPNQGISIIQSNTSFLLLKYTYIQGLDYKYILTTKMMCQTE